MKTHTFPGKPGFAAWILIGITISSFCFAGVADDALLCMKAAKAFGNDKLEITETTAYEPHILNPNVVRWKNAFCQVQIDDVVTLQIDSDYLIYRGYAGVSSYELSGALSKKTNAAISELKSRIRDLEQNQNRVNKDLRKPNPNHKKLTQEIEGSIVEALRGKAPEVEYTERDAKRNNVSGEAPKQVKKQANPQPQKETAPILVPTTQSPNSPINCGLTKIKVQKGQIIWIQHEDGTVQSGVGVSSNWTYDGKSIKHNLMRDAIPCGTQEKNREEVINELSSRFQNQPNVYGFTQSQGKWMSEYTAKLMRSGTTCYLMVDAARSEQRKNMFYIDCNDRRGQSHRYWVSSEDLKSGTLRPPSSSIDEGVAFQMCNAELRSRTTNPATYDPAVFTGTISRTVEEVGRNIVEINFTAANAFGVESKYKGECVLESGNVIDVSISER